MTKKEIGDGRFEIGNQKPHFRVSPLASPISYLLSLFLCLSALAQSKIMHVPAGMPEEIVSRFRAQGYEIVYDNGTSPTPAASVSSTGTTAVSTGRLDVAQARAILQRAGQVDYGRSPSGYYSALAQKQGGGRLAPPDEFAIAVQLGEWSALGALLGRCPEKEAREIYSRLLAGLSSRTRPASDPFSRYAAAGRTDTSSTLSYEELMMRRMNSSSDSSPATAFTEDDFLGVVEAAPAALSDRDVAALAALGRLAFKDASARKRLQEKLAGGLRGFGRATPVTAARTARLLALLGLAREAADYLPATPAVAANLPADEALLAADLLAARGAAADDDRDLEQAWAYLSAAAAAGAAPADLVERILDRIPQLETAFVRRELPVLLRQTPTLMGPLLANLSEAANAQQQQRSEGEEAAARMVGALRTQSLLMESLAAAGGEGAANPALFRGLVWNWMTAATSAREAAEQARQEEQRRAMQQYGYSSSYSSRRGPPLAVSDVLAAAPAESVLALLPAGLAAEVRRAAFALELADFDEPRALARLQRCCATASGDPADLCGHFLVAWVDQRVNALSELDAEMAAQIRQMQMYGMTAQIPKGTGIPVTRARQVRNIAELRTLLVELRKLAPEMDAARVAWAFVKIHSGAEVFRMEDVEAVFGAPEQMNKAELRALLGAFRSGLARGWRDLEAQQKAGTNRTEAEVKDEVSRGYRAALELARRGLGLEGGEWPDALLRGQLFFDAAEFEKDRQIKLADYVELRDASFASFRAAAATYARTVPTLAKSQWTLQPFVAWFSVLLGATDLSALTPGRARNDLGLQALAGALREIPGEAAAGHRALFAGALTNWLTQVPPHMKQKFLIAGLELVGDDPAAAAAREASDFYAGLQSEVQLRVAVDGPTDIGRGQPFGLHLLLEHTAQVAREAGGFGRYLMNQGQQGQNTGYVPPGRRAAVNYRDNLETNLYAMLGPQFDIKSVTFHEPSVPPQPAGRPGWQITPLAYVVLSAKDAAVDRIPSVQLDVDFVDGRGQVVLPVLSQVVPVHAGRAAADRPCPALAVTMTLDTREQSEARVSLEVAATAAGLIPSLPALCDVALPGFKVEVKDSGLALTGLVVEQGASRPQATRTWQVLFARDPAAAAADAFIFPKLKREGVVEYKRFVEADLEAVAAEVATGAGVPLALGGLARMPWMPALLAVVVVAGGVVIWRRRQAKPVTVAHGVALPTVFTPFAVMDYLRRLAEERGGRWSESDRAALREELQRIEEGYFKAGATAALDLRATAERWSTR